MGFFFIFLFMQNKMLFGQESPVKFSAYEGTIILGYVDSGSFLNFIGPNINAVYKQSKFICGMLPSLRFKVDKGTPKNALIFPNLGVGFTYIYKALAIQLPLYYNAKTTSENGNWQIGIGLGIKINQFKKR